MITLPTPEVRTPRSAHSPGRSRKVTFVISQAEIATGTETKAVQILISHSKSSKALSAVAYEVTITKETGSPFVTEAYEPFAGVRLATRSVARFSAKALDEFTAKVLEDFPAHVVSSERLSSWFAPAPQIEEI